MSDFPNTCPQCGSPIPADARFCENCGASFPDGFTAEASAASHEAPADGYGPAAENHRNPSGYEANPHYTYNEGRPDNGYGPGGHGPGGYGPGGYGPGGYGPGGYGPGGYGDGGYGYGRGPATAFLPDSFAKRFFEDFCGSPLFLTFTILVTCQILFEFFGNFLSIFVNIPTIIIAVALWLLFAGSKTHKLKSSPLSLIRGSLIAELVLSIIGNAFMILLFLLALIFSLGVSNEYGYGSEGTFVAAICFVVILVLAASLIVSIFFYRSLMGTTASVKAMLETGQGVPAIPRFARILFIINIIISGLSLLGSFIIIVYSSTLTQYIYNYLNEYNIPSGLINLSGGFTTVISILATMLNIAVLVIAFIIIGKLEGVPFDGGYGGMDYNPDPWGNPGPDAY